MKIAVLGTGYVGLVSAAVFSHLGHQVTGLDIDKKKIKSLSQGKLTIYEPGLDTLVEQGLSSGRLSFTSDYTGAIRDKELVLICVGTPPLPDGSYDSRYVFSAAEAIARNLTGYSVVVIKSTVPPGTAVKV